MSDYEDLTREEIETGAKVFRVIWRLSILLPFAAIAVQIFLGYAHAEPILIIPLWAVSWFLVKVVRRVLFNTWYEAYDHLGWTEQGHENEHEETPLYDANSNQAFPSGFKLPNSLRKFRWSEFVLVALVMLFVSALWYSLGMLLRYLIS